MFEIVEGHANGLHDSLFAPCSSALYVAAGAANHRNCRNNLIDAVEPHGLGYLRVPDSINPFQYSRVRAEARARVETA